MPKVRYTPADCSCAQKTAKHPDRCHSSTHFRDAWRLPLRQHAARAPSSVPPASSTAALRSRYHSRVRLLTSLVCDMHWRRASASEAHSPAATSLRILSSRPSDEKRMSSTGPARIALCRHEMDAGPEGAACLWHAFGNSPPRTCSATARAHAQGTEAAQTSARQVVATSAGSQQLRYSSDCSTRSKALRTRRSDARKRCLRARDVPRHRGGVALGTPLPPCAGAPLQGTLQLHRLAGRGRGDMHASAARACRPRAPHGRPWCRGSRVAAT